jgi:aquaporin Z
MTKRLGAEFLGTAWLVFGGCGSAVLAAAFPGLGIGFVGVSLAFGLTVLTMAYAVGHISGGHFNPAVTVGLWAGGRFKAGEILPYWAAQVLGAVAGAFVLSLIATGKSGFDLAGSGFAANGYAEHSPGGYSLVAGFVARSCSRSSSWWSSWVRPTGEPRPASPRSRSASRSRSSTWSASR